MQDSSTGHFELVLVFGFFNTQRHVGFQFPHQPLADVPSRDKLAFATSQWPVVDGKSHRKRWLVDFNSRERNRVVHAGDGVTNVRIGQTDQGDDVSRLCFRFLFRLCFRFSFLPASLTVDDADAV